MRSNFEKSMLRDARANIIQCLNRLPTIGMC